MDLATYVDMAARARGVEVPFVPADEGLFVGTTNDDRIWVQLTGSGESDYHIEVGNVSDFQGDGRLP